MIWHVGLLYKIKRIEPNGMLLKIIKIFLESTFQRVVLNSQTSSWETVLAGVPQGSVSGRLFFLICVNDLSGN